MVRRLNGSSMVLAQSAAKLLCPSGENTIILLPHDRRLNMAVAAPQLFRIDLAVSVSSRSCKYSFSNSSQHQNPHLKMNDFFRHITNRTASQTTTLCMYSLPFLSKTTMPHTEEAQFTTTDKSHARTVHVSQSSLINEKRTGCPGRPRAKLEAKPGNDHALGIENNLARR